MTMGDGAAIEGHVRIGMEPADANKARSATEPKMAAAPQPVKSK